ncbi:MAG: PilZ domain-containing protein [Deltaproteobacteria bacterium]|nr:PilZ domain-containing protein [Deltaproteobacteria bacterium]
MTDSIKISADVRRNRLNLVASGKISKSDLDRMYTDIRFCVADLTPGYFVVSDYTGCKYIELSSIPAFRKIMNYLISSGVGEIVRVMHGNGLIFRQIINLASRLQGYKPIYVATHEEAEQKIDIFEKRNGLRLYLKNKPVEYLLNNMAGQGQVINISTSGCAVETEADQPSVGTETLIRIGFKDRDDEEEVFDIKAEVVRGNEDSFAVKFVDLEGERKDRLWSYLTHEAQKELHPS